jgi:hypothetical protein
MTGRIGYPEVQGVSIVALGNFNPAIFQPLWFSLHNLIRDDEASGAEVKVIHNEVTIFSTNWFSLQVTDGRFSVETQDPTMYQPIRDLALGTFQILEHTPVRAFGFNRDQHFKIVSADDWHAFGDYFAPKKAWSEILEKPGLRTLTIQGKREGCSADMILLRVEPSPKVPQGIFITVNEHYEVGDGSSTKPGDSMRTFLAMLQGAWDGFLTYCDESARYLLTAPKK